MDQPERRSYRRCAEGIRVDTTGVPGMKSLANHASISVVGSDDVVIDPPGAGRFEAAGAPARSLDRVLSRTIPGSPARAESGTVATARHGDERDIAGGSHDPEWTPGGLAGAHQ
jgi:hypothetical protein